MKRPRIHHYVPRFYLAGFADPDILVRENKEVIWVYERGKEPRRSLPKSEARQRDLYSWGEDDLRNTEVEHWLASLEDQVAPIIASLAKAPRHLTETEREWVALFIGTMQTRTPAARLLNETRKDPLVIQLVREAASEATKFRLFIEQNYRLPAEGEGFDLEEVRRDILAGRLEALAERDDLKLLGIVEGGKMVARDLLDMSWQTIYSQGQGCFLTSDDPVVVQGIDVRANRLQLRGRVTDPNANVWFPLCRDVCVRITKDAESGYGTWISAGIRYVNKMMVMCADRWVYASERSRKIKVLFDRRGGQFDVRTVELHVEASR
jgi:uncharacterized protein DUF4238